VGDKPLSKAGQAVDHRDDLLSQTAAFQTELHHKTEEQTMNCNLAWTAEGVGGMLNLPQRKGVRQTIKLSVLNSQ
jgi:hypothetical protein